MPNKEPAAMIFAGPLQHRDKVGGVVVLFQILLQDLDGHHIIFDTNGDNYTSRIKLLVKFLKLCIFATRRHLEISLHGTVNDFKYLGSILLFFNVFFGLKYHTRKFGGSFEVDYAKMPFFWQLIIQLFLSRSKINFFETRSLVEFFKRFNTNSFWLPNYRRASNRTTSSSFGGKFVFIGHVKKDKGIDEILALPRSQSSNYTVDIFGPLIDYAEEDFSHPVTYQGLLDPARVPDVLSRYDALLLPTFHPGEGYPGVIIEAFSVRLPVITTTWLSLPEIVNESCGVLINPKDAAGLLKAMQKVAENYNNLRDGAFLQFKHFDRNTVVKDYFSKIGISSSGKQ